MDLISDSHVPKYAQIADIFRQRISEEYGAGLRLPANEELATEFGVSRVTIARRSTCCPRWNHRSSAGPRTFITGTLKQDRWLKVETTLSDSPRSTATHRGDHQHFGKPHRRAAAARRRKRRRIMSICDACTRATRAVLRDLDLSG